jgi:hypothetical protein
MAKLVFLLAIIGLAYWYWSGPYQRSAESSAGDQLQENAAILQRCVKQEMSMQSAGNVAGLGDVGSNREDAERLCADKHGLEKRDDGWYSKGD